MEQRVRAQRQCTAVGGRWRAMCECVCTREERARTCRAPAAAAAAAAIATLVTQVRRYVSAHIVSFGLCVCGLCEQNGGRESG